MPSMLAFRRCALRCACVRRRGRADTRHDAAYVEAIALTAFRQFLLVEEAYNQEAGVVSTHLHRGLRFRAHRTFDAKSGISHSLRMALLSQAHQ